MLYHLLFPNFYSLISAGYYLRTDNEVCSDIEFISTLNECKIAVNALNDYGASLVFYESESDSRFPKGCYENNGYVIWNTHHSGSTTFKNSETICKQGEQMEITNVSLKHVKIAV